MNLNFVIELRDVFTVYEGEKRPAIKNINLSISKGELVYVIGPNAAGKTTLLETINGLLKPIKGKVKVLGENMIKNDRKIRCKIGYVPQDFIVKPDEPYKAIDVVLMGIYGKIGMLRRVNEEDYKKAVYAMQLLGIEDLADKPIGKLSGGQQQKVMIARALAKEPEILLLDEPFSNLDQDSRINVSKIIINLQKSKGVTTLIVTHDISQVNEDCNRIVVIDNGRIVADSKPNLILSKFRGNLIFNTLEVFK